LLEEWALRILKPDVPQVLKEALKNNETNERFEKSNSPSGGDIKITNKNFTKKQQQNNRTQNEDFNTTAE
jgi:hypothetical protein